MIRATGSPLARSVKRTLSSERERDRLRGAKKAQRTRRGWACICAVVLFILGVAVLAAKQVSRAGTSKEASTAGAAQTRAGQGSWGWEAAKNSFLLQTGGLMQALGRRVMSAAEQKEVMESLVQSGDDDHESEVVEAGRPASKHSKEPSTAAAAAATAALPRGTSRGASNANRTKTPPQSADVKVIERVPMAGFPSFPGELALSDGTCKLHPKQTDQGPILLDCATQHGFCSAGKCVCTLTYSSYTCGTPKRPFAAHLRAIFEGRFALSASHVRRLQTVKYLVPQETAAESGGEVQHPGRSLVKSLEVPFVKSGKTNRVVWAHLQKGALGKLEPVLSQALLDLLPGRDPLTGAVFRSCALVGNSGLNLLFPNGRTIDSHSAVFRLNDAVTGSRASSSGAAAAAAAAGEVLDFRHHVGARTTLRVLGASLGLVGWQEGPDEVRFSSVATVEHFFEHFQHLNKEPDARSYLVDPDFFNYVAENVRGTPSPFALALFLAVQKCAIVDVYGVHWEPGHGVPEVYYRDTEGPDDEAASPPPHELRLVEAMARAGVVTLAHPCAAGCAAESGIKCTACAPGSTCACGKHSPLPVALPGFCHAAGNVTCFFKCPPLMKSMCQGGPGTSECPEGMDVSGACVAPSHFQEPAELPDWASVGGMKALDRKFEMTQRQTRKSHKFQRRKGLKSGARN